MKFHFALISERTTCWLKTEYWMSVPLESLQWFLENMSYLLQILINTLPSFAGPAGYTLSSPAKIKANIWNSSKPCHSVKLQVLCPCQCFPGAWGHPSWQNPCWVPCLLAQLPGCHITMWQCSCPNGSCLAITKITEVGCWRYWWRTPSFWNATVTDSEWARH